MWTRRYHVAVLTRPKQQDQSQPSEHLHSRFDCLLDNPIRVSEADEGGFELRGRQINPFLQHRVKELAIELPVTLVRTVPIDNRLTSKETGPHRTDAIRDCTYS